MMQQASHLLIKNGRVIDPAQQLNAVKDVAIRHGRIAQIDEDIPVERAWRVIDAAGLIVTPGLIDLHTHVFAGLNISVEPDPVAAKSGVTTMVDAGTAGAANFRLFRDHVVARATTRIIPFLNIWITGGSMMSMPSEQLGDLMSAGESSDRTQGLMAYFGAVRYAPVEEAERVIEEHRQLIAGVKVWVNRFVAGGDIEPLRRAKGLASRLGLPLMVCTYFGPPWMEEILPYLEEGDIQTHFLGTFTRLVDDEGGLLEAAVKARDRGVVFDVGHGAGSFDFDVARRALAAGFKPDVISTDLHSENVDGPVYDLPTTMSKFIALGMDLEDVVRATTVKPAEVLGMDDVIGSMRVGMEADVALFDLVEGPVDLVDTEGQHIEATQRLVNVLTIKGGDLMRDPD